MLGFVMAFRIMKKQTVLVKLKVMRFIAKILSPQVNVGFPVFTSHLAFPRRLSFGAQSVCIVINLLVAASGPTREANSM